MLSRKAAAREKFDRWAGTYERDRRSRFNEMVNRARELAGDLSRVEFVVGDSEELPFPDHAFTALVCTSSFHHYPAPWRALAEMARVLAVGGRVSCSRTGRATGFSRRSPTAC